MPAEGDDGDVIFLAELMSYGGDFRSRQLANLRSTIEAKEFSGAGAGLDDAVGEQGQSSPGGQGEGGLTIGDAGKDAKWKAGFDGNFRAVEVGSQMAGIGEDDLAVWSEYQAETGYEAGVFSAEQHVV